MSGDTPTTGLGAVAVVRRCWQAASAGNISPELWDEGLRIDNMAGFPVTGPYDGRAGLRQWWADIAEVARPGLRGRRRGRARRDPRPFGTAHARAFSTTAISVDAQWASLVGVKDGKIAHATGYASHAHALRAAAKQGLDNT